MAALPNMPPDPFDAFRLHIEDLFEQARQFLDGEPIKTEQQAEDVSRLLNMLRKASSDADDARKAEKKPYDDAAKNVQTKWKPILDKVDLAATTAKNALAPFLKAKEDAQRAAAEAQRQEAERLAQTAAQAAREARPDDLAGLTTARVLQENAAAAVKQADRLGKAKSQARGGERAIGLRTFWSVEITDAVAFGKWAWEHRRDEYLEFLNDLAERECRHGPKEIPGIRVDEDRKPV